MSDRWLCEECGTVTERRSNPNRPSLSARYEAMPKAEWFKRAHDGRSLGDALRVDDVSERRPK